MENKMDYIKEAKRTLSDKFYGENVAILDLFEVLKKIAEYGHELDLIKKAVFYGRRNLVRNPGFSKASLNNIKAIEEQKTINIVHGVIGKITETCELAEALSITLRTQQPLDLTNILEEIGDGFWYDAIILDELGSSFEEAQRINIEKLKARFPEKFTEHNANNRDLEKERQILEQK